MSNGHKRIYAVKLQSGYGIVKWISSLHLRRSFPKTDVKIKEILKQRWLKLEFRLDGSLVILIFFFKFVDITK